MLNICKIDSNYQESSKESVENVKDKQKRHSCNICQATFQRPSHLLNHFKRIHEKQESFICEYCNLEFEKKPLLDNHLYTIHRYEAAKIECSQCKKLFVSQTYLNIHMTKIHSLSNTNDDLSKICSYCSKEFQFAWKRRQHEEIVHKGTDCYKCETCNKSFNSSSKLNRHILTHSNEKRFKCEYDDCNAEFSRRDHYKNHLNLHLKEKQFKCDFENCNSKFKYQNNLITHKKIHLKQQETSNLIVNNFSEVLSQVEPVENAIQSQQNDTGISFDLNEVMNATVGVCNSYSFDDDFLYQSKKPKNKHVININSDDEGYAASSVVLENLSGSARTDYKSNHIYIEKRKARLKNEHMHLKRSRSLQREQTSGINPKENSDTQLVDAIIDRNQNDCYYQPFKKSMRSNSETNLNNYFNTSNAISFKDPFTGNTIIQTQLLQDDPPLLLDILDSTY